MKSVFILTVRTATTSLADRRWPVASGRAASGDKAGVSDHQNKNTPIKTITMEVSVLLGL